MTTTKITSIEDLRALEGHKVTLEYDYMYKDHRKRQSLPSKRTARTVGTIVRDDRVPSLERYIIQRQKHGNVIYPDGQRVIKIA